MSRADLSPLAEALVLIDFQRGFDHPYWGARNNPTAEENALRLLAAFRSSGLVVFHVRHLSRDPGSALIGAGAEFKDGFSSRPEETLIEKTVNSAFIGTTLEAQLRDRGIKSLTICGLTTPHCVSTTTRMAANLGWSVALAHDACAAFARNADVSFDDGPAFTPEDTHRAALAQLHGEFANVVATDAVIGRITRR